MRQNEVLKEYLDGVFQENPIRAKQIIKEIKLRCGISRHIYSNWRRGVSKIGVLECREINKVVGFNLLKDVSN